MFSASVASAVVMAMPVTTTFGRPFPVVSCAIGAVGPSPSSVAPEGERHVVSAEAERVVDCVLVVAVARFTSDDVEVDLRIRRLVVQRGG